MILDQTDDSSSEVAAEIVASDDGKDGDKGDDDDNNKSGKNNNNSEGRVEFSTSDETQHKSAERIGRSFDEKPSRSQGLVPSQEDEGLGRGRLEKKVVVAPQEASKAAMVPKAAAKGAAAMPNSIISNVISPMDISDVAKEVNDLSAYMSKLAEAGVSVDDITGEFSPAVKIGSYYEGTTWMREGGEDYCERDYRTPRRSDRSSTNRRVELKIEEATVTKTLRGSGSGVNAGGSRVHRRLDIEHPERIRHEQQVKRKPQIKYYKHDPDKRSNVFKGGAANKGWDKLTNEVDFVSSVPTTMKNMFPLQPSKYYRHLSRVVNTLDNVGTKAASPTHLIYQEKAEDWSNTPSKVSRIWKDPRRSKKGAAQRRKGISPEEARRPSDWLLESMMKNSK